MDRTYSAFKISVATFQTKWHIIPVLKSSLRYNKINTFGLDTQVTGPAMDFIHSYAIYNVQIQTVPDMF